MVHLSTEDRDARSPREALLARAARQVIDFTGYGFVILDAAGCIVWANPGFLGRYGYGLPEIEGMTLETLLCGPLTDKAAFRPLEEARGRLSQAVANFLSYTREGRAGWVEMTLEPLSWTGPAEVEGDFFIVVSRDITRRKLTEALGGSRRLVLRMLTGEADLRQVLTALVGAIETVSSEMRCTIMLVDAGGRNLRVIAAPRLPVEYQRALEIVPIGPGVGCCGAAAHTGQRVISRDMFDDPNWRPYLEHARLSRMRACWSEPIIGLDGKVLGTFAMYYPTPLLPNPAELEFIRQAAEIAAAAIDRKMLERDLDQARIRAEEASLAKSRFLANMSHELRTPLNAVIGFSELMASGMLQGEVKRYQDYAVEVVRSAHELLSLISSLLDAANLQQGEYELHEDVIDPASLIHICLKEKSDWARRRGVVLGFEPPDAAPTLSADFDSVHKVIGKILDNALKHTPQGGVIDIGMSLKPAGELVISIRDSGEGIKEEDLSRIVHPFEQGGFASAYLARRYGGAGLGLAISHMLMQLHGGNVALKSEPGKGTLAEIIFPPSRVTAGGMI